MTFSLLRILSGLNAAYQGVVGLLSILAPEQAGKMYQLTNLSPESAALTRILGGMMVGNALLLAVFAREPKQNPSLPALIVAGTVANLAAPLVACLKGEIRLTQVAGSIGFQSVFLLVLLAYLWRASRPAAES